MNHLNLPKFDPNEDLEKIKREVLNKEDQEIEREKRLAAKRRETLRRKLEERTNKVVDIQRATVAQWRAVARTIGRLIMVRKDAIRQRREKRD